MNRQEAIEWMNENRGIDRRIRHNDMLAGGFLYMQHTGQITGYVQAGSVFVDVTQDNVSEHDGWYVCDGDGNPTMTQPTKEFMPTTPDQYAACGLPDVPGKCYDCDLPDEAKRMQSELATLRAENERLKKDVCTGPDCGKPSDQIAAGNHRRRGKGERAMNLECLKQKRNEYIDRKNPEAVAAIELVIHQCREIEQLREELAALRAHIAELEAAQASKPCPRCIHHEELTIDDWNCCRSCIHDAVDNYEPAPVEDGK